MAKSEPRITWTIEEYTYKEKGPDWYWALGIIAVAGASIAVITHNITFAIFIIVGALILGVYANKRPDLITIGISDEGVMVRNYLYLFEKIKGFAIDEHDLGNFLLIETTRAVTPIISIPLPEGLDGDGLRALLKTKITEKKLSEPVSHRIMEHIGF